MSPTSRSTTAMAMAMTLANVEWMSGAWFFRRTALAASAARQKKKESPAVAARYSVERWSETNAV